MNLASIERFWAKVDRSGGFVSCWPWRGAMYATGYGEWHPSKGRKYMAHRVSYELLNGPIPDGLTLDHLCRNRACVNPSHLEPVTNRENILRGESPAAHHARKTHCPQGHEYTPENTVMHNGARECRECVRARGRRRQQKETPEQRAARLAYIQAYNKRLRESGYYATPEYKAYHREYEKARYHRNKGH